MLAVFAEAGTTGATVSSLAGGGVSTWTKGVSFIGTGGVDTEIWFGKVTATGAQTITFTWSGSIAGHTTEYGAQEFSAGAGGFHGVGPRQVRHHQRRLLHHGAVPEPHPERLRRALLRLRRGGQQRRDGEHPGLHLRGHHQRQLGAL